MIERLKNSILVLILLGVFFGYSYYNYSIRRKAVNAIEEYRIKNNLIEIWSYREMHFNIFDWLLEDKSQFNFIFVSADLIEKKDNKDYWVYFSSWKDAQNIETLTNYKLERNKDKFRIAINDLFLQPTERDSLNINEIEGTVFETVDNWVREEYKQAK